MNTSASLPEVVRRVREDEPSSVGGYTEKLVLGAHDGLQFETVRIPMGRGRESLCLSTQIGCGQGCRFCETALMGMLRNLTADEIVAQVVLAQELGWQPRSLVFMGMGEALDNATNVFEALRTLMSPQFAFSQKRITICTVGHAEGIRRLAELPYKRLNLSLSLNAPDDELRRRIMPITKRFPLADVQDALLGYRRRKNLQFGINYCLMPGINDEREHARGIARFCAPLGRLMVYLIPYNPGSRPLTRPPNEAEVDTFVSWLRAEGLPVRRRIPKGRDVMAACGQLGNPRKVHA